MLICFRKLLPMLLLLAVAGIYVIPANAAVVNGSFEDLGYERELSGWNWWTKGSAPAGFERVSNESTRGAYSVRVWKDNGVEAEKYGSLDQRLTGLPKGTMIHIAAMVKGKGVERAWMGDFANRQFIPNGDFDWQQIHTSIQLGPEQTEYTLMFGIEGKIGSLWIDDVRMVVGDEPLPEDKDWLFISRMDDLSAPTGFLVIARNPLGSPQKGALQFRLCDPFGLPLEEKQTTLELAPGMQHRVFVPVSPEKRVALLTASLVDTSGRLLAAADDFIAIEPKSLAPNPGSDRFGVDEINFAYVSGDRYNRLINLMAAAGVKHLRGYEMDRCYDEANKTIDPSRFSRFLNDLKTREISVLPILAYGPTWASTAGPFATDWEKRMNLPKLDVWCELVDKFVRDLGFKEVEVWNEPNGGFWNTFPKDVTYGKLVAATCDTVKKIDPAITVVGCSTNSDSPGWPESVIKAAGQGKLDAISFHPYREAANEPTPQRVETNYGQYASYPKVVEEMDKMSSKYNNGKPLPLYITEFGVDELDGNLAPYLQGNALYKAGAVARMSLTLAGTGVKRAFWYEFRDLHPQRFGLVRKDLTIKPGWWAYRTVSEQAAGRTVGKLQQIGTDLFGLTMTGGTNVVAVWTAESPAVVTVKKPVNAADLFGLPVLAVTAKGSTFYAIPAGCVLYFSGDNKLSLNDVQPVLSLVPKSNWALAGEKNVYDIVPAKDAPKKLTIGLPVSADFTVEPSPGAWTTGKLEFKLAGNAVSVPVFKPVSDKTTAELIFDEECHPSVRLDNMGKDEIEAKVTITAANKQFAVEKTVAVKPRSVLEVPVEARPASGSPGIDVVADVLVGQRKWSFERTLWFAAVPARNGIKLDGQIGDWQGVPMVELADWDKNAGDKPVDPVNLSAKMGLAYDSSKLYVLVGVRDDKHYQKFAPAESWMGDSVQLAFDTDPMGKHEILEMNFAVDEGGKYMFNSRQMNVNVDEVKASVLRKGDETIYELAFPLSLLRVKGGAGGRQGFSLIVNENDTGAREGYLRWSKGIGDRKDALKYGQLLLQ